MSELPKFAGQSCCGAGAGGLCAVLQRLAPGVDGRAVGGVAGVVPHRGAVGPGRGGVHVVAEELARSGRSRSSRAGRPARRDAAR